MIDHDRSDSHTNVGRKNSLSTMQRWKTWYAPCSLAFSIGFLKDPRSRSTQTCFTTSNKGNAWVKRHECDKGRLRFSNNQHANDHIDHIVCLQRCQWDPLVFSGLVLYFVRKENLTTAWTRVYFNLWLESCHFSNLSQFVCALDTIILFRFWPFPLATGQKAPANTHTHTLSTSL